MFAFFMIVICGCVGLYRLIEGWNYDRKRRNDALKNGRSYYTDRYNHFVDAKTNVPYRYTGGSIELKNGKWVHSDLVKVQAYTGKPIRNLTEEKRERIHKERAAAKAEAIKNGEQYYLYERVSWDWPGHSNCDRLYECQLADTHMRMPLADTMWADVNTDTRYFIYNLGGINVLLNIETGQLEKIVDEEKYSEERIEGVKNRINQINERNKRLYDWCFTSSYNWSNKLHVA